MKRITFHADESEIEAAGARARAEQTTVNEQVLGTLTVVDPFR